MYKKERSFWFCKRSRKAKLRNEKYTRRFADQTRTDTMNSMNYRNLKRNPEEIRNF